jgi:hypothetical protein
MKKINKLINKYDAHIYAFLLTTLFMGLWCVVILEIINKIL